MFTGSAISAPHIIHLFKYLFKVRGGKDGNSSRHFCFQEGEQFVKKIGGIFAFKVKDGPGGKEATWVVDVKNGKGSVLPNSGQYHSGFPRAM